MQKPVVALLPMKGHSERVPNKNMRLFGGKPLYHTVMNTLLSVPKISIIAINTDSEVIANNAINNFGNRVKIIHRPENIQGDFVSMNEIINYDLGVLQEQEYFLQTHSTNPLLKATTINNAIDRYFENIEKHDSVFSVTRWQTRFYWQDGKPVNHNPDELLRTQDLPALFEENSNFYIFSKTSFFNNEKKRIGKNPSLFSMEKIEAIDIDEEQDFILAEAVYNSTTK
jgi:CMP-N-acetylneuraminic acid synthetase